MKRSDIVVLHGLAQEALNAWLDEGVPNERRLKKAFELLVESTICLQSCCINLGDPSVQRGIVGGESNKSVIEYPLRYDH